MANMDNIDPKLLIAKVGDQFNIEGNRVLTYFPDYPRYLAYIRIC